MKMYVKKSSLENNFLLPYKQTNTNFFPDFSRRENDKNFYHNFQDCVWTLDKIF